MEKTPPFHADGVCPTSPAISPTLVFTVSNIPDKFPVIPLIRSSFSHSVILSIMLCIGCYRLTEQPGEQRHKYHADKGNTAPCHELSNTQLNVAGGGV